MTCLHRTARNGHLEAVMGILNDLRFESANEKDNDGKTALIYAAERGHFEVVRELLNYDEREVNHKDNSGWNALHYACFNSHNAVVSELVTIVSLQEDSKDKDLRNALHLAACGGNDAVVEALLNRQDDTTTERNEIFNGINDVDNFGKTALIYAADNGHVNIVKKLLKDTRFNKLNVKDKVSYETLSVLLCIRIIMSEM